MGSGFCKRIEILSGKSIEAGVFFFIKQILPDSVLFQYMVSYKLSPKSYIAKDGLTCLEQLL